MSDREDSDQPRKRIAVAVRLTRELTTRSAGDAASARSGAAAIRETAGHVPIARTRATNRVCSYGSPPKKHPLNDTSEYTYNMDASRAYANPRGTAVSPMSPLQQYAHEITGDGLTAYRQSPYPYATSKGYYPNMSGWAGAYQDDGGVDYGLSYSSYPIINQEPAAPPLVSGYATTPYNTRKSVYVDPAETTPPYSYGSLVHRPAAAAAAAAAAASNDAQGFSLSSMAASLPSASDRLHSSVNRTLTSSSSSNYRTDGLPGYQNGKTASADVAYSALQPSFEQPYSTTTALASAIAHRATAHADAAYPPATAAATDHHHHHHHQQQQLYGSAGDRAEDPLSYVYSDSNTRRRDSHSTGGGSLLSNGHVYVPESHHAGAYVVPPSAHPPPAAPSRSLEGTGTSASLSSSSSSSATSSTHHRQREDAHRRSAGSLRGGLDYALRYTAQIDS
ncbi:hypothetical protein CIB48_g10884 [Xylaria polymorpha]|nr:hypothetical protein CIB48_g10884 [Xylaria polymorpha]